MIKDILSTPMVPTATDESRWFSRGTVVRVDGATIRSVMRDLELQAAQPRATVRTTVPAEDLGERPDLLERDFTSDEPGRKWCGDISPQAGGAPSYVRTRTGFIYLATVLDCWHLEGCGLCDG